MENRAINLSHFQHILTDTHTGIDASVFLLEPEDRLQRFLANLDAAQEATHATVWITRDGLEEIRTKLDDVQLVNIARRSLQYILERCRQKRIIVYEPEKKKPDGPAFADSTLLTMLLENRIRTPITLLTQDKALAVDAMRINDFGSVRGNRIMVYRINGAGIPVRFHMVRAEDGSLVLPQASGLYAPPNTPRARVSCEQAPPRMHAPGDTLYDADGNLHTLGTSLHISPDSQVFTSNENEGEAIKLFIRPSPMAQAKCTLLTEIRFPCKEAVMPEQLLYDADGRFAGYTMQRIHGVRLDDLFTQEGRMAHAPDWTRMEFAQLAHAIAAGAANLAAAGIQLTNLHPSNILVRRESSAASPSPASIAFIGLDTAQFGTERTGVYPGQPCPAAYAAPEYHALMPQHDDPTPPPLYPQSALAYSTALVCLQCLLLGAHPFSIRNRRSHVDPPLINLFPFYADTDPASCILPRKEELLWSYIHDEQQQLFCDLFRTDGKLHAPASRPTPFRLAAQLKRHVIWLRQEQTQLQYPEALSLNPQTLRDAPPEPADATPDASTCTASLADVTFLRTLRELLTPAQHHAASGSTSPFSRIGQQKINDVILWASEAENAAITLLRAAGYPVPPELKPGMLSSTLNASLFVDPVTCVKCNPPAPQLPLKHMPSVPYPDDSDPDFGTIPVEGDIDAHHLQPTPPVSHRLRPLRRLFSRLLHPLA